MKSIIFPGKFLVGQGILADLPKFCEALGKKPLVVASKSNMDRAKAQIGSEAVYEMFGGECTHAEVQRLVEVGKTNGCDYVVGIGGGKLLDCAKSVAMTPIGTENPSLNCGVAIVPTIAATDAPCSALTVAYTADGVFESYDWLPKNPDFVLVDSDIIATAPARYLVSGMGDALATYFEARAIAASDSGTCAVCTGGKQAWTALNLAKLCYETLLSDGLKAKLSVEAGVVTPALERIIEANILLSGIGFESGGLAAAHAVHNGLTALEQTHEYQHGEKVAIGTLTQLVMENVDLEELDEVYSFCEEVGLPTTLDEIGLAGASDEDLMKAAEAASVEGETIHGEPFEVTAYKVCAAMKTASEIGKSRK